MTTQEQIPTFGDDSYEERIKQWEKEKKGLVSDLAEKREKIRSLEERLATVETTLTSAADDNGEETPEMRVNRLAADPDGYIVNHLRQFEQEQLNPLKQELQMLKVDRQIERGLRWVAKQEKKDYEDVAGSELEQELARITVDMRNRGIVPTNPEEGTKEAYRLLLQERKDREVREREREERIDGNRTETVTVGTSRGGSRRWTREEVNALDPHEFTKHEADIRESAKHWK